MQIKLKISHSVNHKKRPFCVLRTKVQFIKNVPLLTGNNPASVCPSNNSIRTPNKQFFPTLYMTVFLCKLTSIIITPPMERLLFRELRGVRGTGNPLSVYNRPASWRWFRNMCSFFYYEIGYLMTGLMLCKFRTSRKSPCLAKIPEILFFKKSWNYNKMVDVSWTFWQKALTVIQDRKSVV